MPKMKTHKGAKSRFHTTGTGKLMRAKGMKSHLCRNKSKRVIGLFDEMIEVHKSDRKRISRLLPYGSRK
jgi:large subunit ribosomal protein L35